MLLIRTPCKCFCRCLCLLAWHDINIYRYFFKSFFSVDCIQQVMCACGCVYYITNINQMILELKFEKHHQRSRYICFIETLYTRGPFYLSLVCDCILDDWYVYYVCSAFLHGRVTGFLLNVLELFRTKFRTFKIKDT